MLNIMTLEQQLLEEIKERQEKLEKLQGVSPKLKALEALLSECQSVCDEFGMTDLFTNLLGSFSGTASTSKQANPTPTNNANPGTLTDKEIKAIRLELKTFLEYYGQRLNDKTAKELLVKKLEDLNRTNLLTEVNLDDKDNFLAEAKKLINLLAVSGSDFKEEVKEEVKVPDTFPVTYTVTDGIKTLAPNLAVTVEDVEGLSPKDAVKSALVQSAVTGYYGTVEQDGVIANVEGEECACIKYPQETLLTPLTQLKLISPAIFTPTPVIEKIKEEVSIEEEEEIKDMTPQDKAMWDAMLEIFSAEELSAMATDPETIQNFNFSNGTNLTALPIADLYEYATGNSRIQ